MTSSGPPYDGNHVRSQKFAPPPADEYTRTTASCWAGGKCVILAPRTVATRDANYYHPTYEWTTEPRGTQS